MRRRFYFGYRLVSLEAEVCMTYNDLVTDEQASVLSFADKSNANSKTHFRQMMEG